MGNVRYRIVKSKEVEAELQRAADVLNAAEKAEVNERLDRLASNPFDGTEDWGAGYRNLRLGRVEVVLQVEQTEMWVAILQFSVRDVRALAPRAPGEKRTPVQWAKDIGIMFAAALGVLKLFEFIFGLFE